MGENNAKHKKDIKLLIFVAIGLLGLIILVVGNMMSKEDESVGAMAEVSTPSPDEYSERVEGEIRELCVGVSGGYDAIVVVSLSGGYRSVYATDNQSGSGSNKSNTVLVGSGSNEEALVVCYENPEISGVGIVLSCPESDELENNIIRLVSAAFNVKTNKIHVSFK